ncbi:MAG: DnaB-like helicase C-terminal domain-containing protein, partial [Bacteroidetes bacterium]|nr:DnaB-like helicase C-terminal domain-containing protein [Bacteroidota bacterium]
TSLATDIISNTIPDNLKVAFFTLEMSKEQVVNKIISQNLEIPAQRIKKWDLSFQEKEDVQNFKSQILDSNIKINFKPGINIVQMKRSLRRLVSKIGPLDLIVIDYLQLMGTYGKYESKEKAVSDISKGLKEVAREFKCPVIALSQLNRKPEERKGDHKPIMSDLRESGAIEQDADIIIFLYREDYYKKDTENQGVTEGIISKNRQGPTGSFYLQFIKEYTHFENSTFQNDGSF